MKTGGTGADHSHRLSGDPLPDITRYGIYRERRQQAIKLAIEWFDKYLKK